MKTIIIMIMTIMSQSVCVAMTKCHRPDSLKTREIYCSQFWMLEVQSQGAWIAWCVSGEGLLPGS